MGTRNTGYPQRAPRGQYADQFGSKKALAAAITKLDPRIKALAAAVRTLPAKVPGTAPLANGLEKAAGLLRSFNTEADSLEAQRAPLKSAVQKAIFDLREELDQMDGRLRSHCSQVFIDSLYPELSRKGTAVADEDDEDDDTVAPPET